ncbi:hypothetical protein AAHA92_22572 [Salvia divinorum]|uniref:Ubiquitin-like protease family profile domain-containing protein n=1 Tax=Salvia divinorum TaxID=28513 RepID=A0ABD1GQ99_SALDI
MRKTTSFPSWWRFLLLAGSSTTGNNEVPIHRGEDDKCCSGKKRKTSNVEMRLTTTTVHVMDTTDDKRLKVKRTPRNFVGALKTLNDKQISSVKAMGFGALLHYNVIVIPSKLAYWVLDNFDPISCSIRLPGGGALHIDEKDVQVMFGFPRGDIRVERSERQLDLSIMDQLTGCVGPDWANVLPNTIEREMLKDQDGGDWFKKLFLILMESALIETSACGYVRPKILNFIQDVTNVKKFNWCGYLLSILIRSHRQWTDHKSSAFSRPIAFLVLFYADRVIHGQREVRQYYPLIKGWNEVILKQRQDAELKDGAYGLAHVINRVEGMAAGENDLIDGEIIGPGETTSDPEFDPIASITQSMSTEAYRDEKWIETIDSLVKAAKEMEILDNKDDFPSFSLGFEFTHDLHRGTVSIGKIVNVVSRDDGVLAKEQGAAQVVGGYEITIGGERTSEVVPEERGADQMVSDSEYNIEESVLLVTSLQDDQEHIDSMVCSAMEAIMEIGVEAFCSTTGEKGMNEIVEKTKLTHDTAIEERCDEEAIDTAAVEAIHVREMHLREVRTRSEKRLSPALCSPYNERVVRANQLVSSEEKELYYWAVGMKTFHAYEVVYDDDIVSCQKIRMCSLFPHEFVNVEVIDAWASYLNCMESCRAPSSPFRLFMTTAPALYSVVNRTKDWDASKAMSNFSEHVGSHVLKMDKFDWNNYDMVFFPMPQSLHHYLVCFGKKTGKIDIIDNIQLPAGHSVFIKYKTELELLRFLQCVSERNEI